MDLIFWLLLGTALLAVAAILVKLITSQWLKERLRDYLSDRNVDSALVIKRSAVEAMLVEATKNAPRAKLKDLKSALKDLENVDLILCSQDKDGEIRKLEKIKGEQGIEEPLDLYLDENDGLLIFT